MLNFDDIQSTYRKQPPFTREFFNERIKPELNLFQDAAEELNYRKQAIAFFDEIVEQAELRLTQRYGWIYGRYHDTHHGNAERWVFYYPVEKYTYAGNQQRYRARKIKHWDLVIAKEKFDEARVIQYGQKLAVFIHYREYSMLEHKIHLVDAIPGGASETIDGTEWRTRIDWKHSGWVDNATPGLKTLGNYNIPHIGWINQDNNLFSLTSNTYMQPGKNFNEADLNDGDKVRAFKETFKTFPGSPLNKIYTKLREDITVAQNNYDSAKNRFATLLRSLNTGLRAEHFENNTGNVIIRDWGEFTRHWKLAPVTGEITIESLRTYFDTINREEYSDKVKFFKGRAAGQHNYPIKTENQQKLRVSPSLVPLQITGGTKLVSAFGFKNIGLNEEGERELSIQDLVNPANQQNVEIKVEHFTLGVIWLMRDVARLFMARYGILHVVGNNLVKDVWWDQHGDEFLYQAPEEFIFHEIDPAGRTMNERLESWLVDDGLFEDDGTELNTPPPALHVQGSGRTDTRGLYGLIIRLRRRINTLYNNAFTDFNLSPNSPITKEQYSNIRAEGLTPNLLSDLWELKRDDASDKGIYAETLNGLFEHAQNAIQDYSDETPTGALLKNGLLDMRICHSSCHGSCHGSRSRR